MNTQTQEIQGSSSKPTIPHFFIQYKEPELQERHIDFFPKETRHENTSGFRYLLFLRRKKTRVVLLSCEKRDGYLYPVFKKTDGYRFPDRDAAEKYLGKKIRDVDSCSGEIVTIIGNATHQVHCKECGFIKPYKYGPFKVTVSGIRSALNAKTLFFETGQQCLCTCEEWIPLSIRIDRENF